MIDVPDEFTVQLMRAVRKAGATPVVEVRHTRVNREIMRETDDKHASLVRDLELARMRRMQAYIASAAAPMPTRRATCRASAWPCIRASHARF